MGKQANLKKLRQSGRGFKGASDVLSDQGKWLVSGRAIANINDTSYRSVRLADMPYVLFSRIQSLDSIKQFHGYCNEIKENASFGKCSNYLLKVVDKHSSENEVFEVLELFRVYTEILLASLEVSLSAESKNSMYAEIYQNIKKGFFFATWEYDGDCLILPEIIPCNPEGADMINEWQIEIFRHFRLG